MANPCYLRDSVFDDTTVLSASTTDPSSTVYDVKNIIDLRPYTFWQAGTATGVKYITIDAGTAVSANTWAIGPSHNLFTAGANIAIQHSSDNFVSIATAATYTFTENKTHGASFTSASNRYWRFAITQPTTVKVKFSVGLIGDRFTFPRQMARGINPNMHTVISNGADSKTLQPLGVIIRGKQRQFDVNFNALETTWVLGTFLPEWNAHLGESKPFIWKWDTAIDTACYFMQVEPNASWMSNYLQENNDYSNLQMRLKGPYEE